ncbi:MAG: tetratricopeptide repeat protein [Planctomycetes bacterium]|nr:tetratricopeptide repeat protein [Planctomycetota bacterium]MCW8135628.1 tetratricopeptide repeat protein [Planctomycetota bacterium]
MLYDDKAPDVLKKYGVRAFPTFIVTDADGKEEMRQVGAPFSTPADAIKWFEKVGDAFVNLPKYEAAYEKSADDHDNAIKLADAYAALGKADKAMPIYEKLAEKLPKDDKRRVDVQLAYAQALIGTATRENQAEVGAKIQKIYDDVLPGLVKAKDERALEPGILNARLKSGIGKDHDGARKDLKALIEAFPETSRMNELMYWAAAIAQQAGDNDAAKAEFQALIKRGPAEDDYVKAAQRSLDRMK